MPSPYPSPDCPVGSHQFSAKFLPGGESWSSVTASVYYGTWQAQEGRSAANPMITQLSEPFPDRDYLCIVSACYTIEFVHSEESFGLSFTIESEADERLIEVDDAAGSETFLQFCANASDGTFNHAPTFSPTISSYPTPQPSTAYPSPGPSVPPTSAPSPFPTPDCVDASLHRFSFEPDAAAWAGVASFAVAKDGVDVFEFRNSFPEEHFACLDGCFEVTMDADSALTYTHGVVGGETRELAAVGVPNSEVCGCTSYVNGATEHDATLCVPNSGQCRPPNDGDGLCSSDAPACVLSHVYAFCVNGTTIDGYPTAAPTPAPTATPFEARVRRLHSFFVRIVRFVGRRRPPGATPTPSNSTSPGRR